MPLPPLRFAPILKTRAWGGSSLSLLGKSGAANASAPVGESWEIADLPPPVEDGTSRVAGGPYDGQRITDLLGTHRKALLGRAAPTRDGRFPLLLKYLDAREPLSVQVHPTPEYAAAHPGAHPKTEAWIVLHADPGAVIYRGIRHDVTPERFRAAIGSGAVTELLLVEQVEQGDCIPLRSGLCHALGAGVVVAEVQTPSDTTFRVFDWNRGDPARPLHIEQAMECALFGAAQRLEDAPVQNLRDNAAGWAEGLRSGMLVRNECFCIEAIESSPAGDAAPMEVVTDGMPVVAMLVRGEATLHGVGPGARRLSLHAGDTLLFPAELTPSTLALGPDALLLRVTPADPEQRHRDPLPRNQFLA